MATEILDLRRTDERNTYLQHPIWIASAVINKTAQGKAAILFSFPSSKYKHVLVHDIAVEVTEGFVGGTVTLDIGRHSIPLETSTTGGVATVTDSDAYIPAADIPEASVRWSMPATGAFITEKAAGSSVMPVQIPVYSSNILCISAELASSGTITAGQARVHALVSLF